MTEEGVAGLCATVPAKILYPLAHGHIQRWTFPHTYILMPKSPSCSVLQYSFCVTNKWEAQYDCQIALRVFGMSTSCDLLYFSTIFNGGEGTDILVYSSTFYTVKPNSSSHCYIERKDVVHCWNAASSRVKISILETANFGSCVLLNPVALCKPGGTLSGSPYTTEQDRAGPIRWPSSQVVWQAACLYY